MSTPKGPVITGVHHVCLTVTTLDACRRGTVRLELLFPAATVSPEQGPAERQPQCGEGERDDDDQPDH
jgi:hypothetical protein